MSGIGFEPWFQALRQASFRGVPFYVDGHESAHGRRLAEHEFPLRDNPSSEDIGRSKRVYRMRAYLVGPAYNVTRDALIGACESSAGPGTLVHPYYGELQVWCRECQVRETEKRGRTAELDLAFVETGNVEPLPASLDTAQVLALAATQLFGLINEGFAVAYIVAVHPNVLTAAAVDLLAGVADGFLSGLGLTVEGLAAVAASGIAVFATGADPVQAATSAATAAPIAAAVIAAAAAAADDLAATALASPPPTPGAAGSGNLLAGMDGTVTPAADWTGGLLAVATAAAAVPPVLGSTATRLQQATNQQAIAELAAGAATAAILAVLAARTWATAAEAAAAQCTVIDLVDCRINAAAAVFNDPLYLAWTGALGATMQDLDARVAGLPVLGAYTTPIGLPSLTLAQRLYTDPTRADQLRALNNVRRPLFMPPAGAALVA